MIYVCSMFNMSVYKIDWKKSLNTLLMLLFLLQSALQKLLDVTYGLETVAISLISTYTKARTTAIEVRSLTLLGDNVTSHSRRSCITMILTYIINHINIVYLTQFLTVHRKQNIFFETLSAI